MNLETIREMVADGYTSEIIAAKLGVSKKRVLDVVAKHDLGPWRKRIHYQEAKTREVPEGFAENAKAMTLYALSRHYQCASGTVKRWVKETGIQPAKAAKLDVDLETLATMYETMTMAEIGKRFGVGRDAVSRMLRKAGLIQPRVAKPKTETRATIDAMGRPPAPVNRYHRDMSLAGQAADHMRKYGPVYREGNGWRRGNSLLSDEEIIERASGKGFRYVCG